MSFLDAESMQDFVSFLLFVFCALLVALLVWVLLRRRRHAYRAQRDAEGTTTGEPSMAKRPSIDVPAGGVGMPSGARITPDANGPAGTSDGPRLVSGSDSARTAGADAARTAAAISAPSGEATSKGAAESFASKELSSERMTSGLSSMDNQEKGGVASAHASKSKRRKDGGRRSSGGGGGSKSSSRRASVQRSQASSVDKAGKSSSSERPAVPALLIRRPSSDSKSSLRSTRSTRYVGDKPKVPPALDIFSREHSSMAESPPPVSSPPLDTAPKPAQGPDDVPSPAAGQSAAAP